MLGCAVFKRVVSYLSGNGGSTLHCVGVNLSCGVGAAVREIACFGGAGRAILNLMGYI